jgi:Fe-S cluster assembly scaffold protein SufB
MAMRNAKNASKKFNFWQIDHKVLQILKVKGVEVLTSPEAFEKYKIAREIFKEKPKEGYFVWVKEKIDFPLTTCITIATKKISQELQNLLIVEKGIKVIANVLCNSAKKFLHGAHFAKGKILLKEGALLEYNHIHRWGEKDFVNPDYEFILEKNSKIIYNYQNLLPPENLRLKTTLRLKENAACQVNVILNGINSKIKVEETIFLDGKNSQGILKVRALARKNSRIIINSAILANAKSQGHLDCQGLIVDKKSKISLIPALICQNKEAQITHEASIGKISEEQLTYLRMRGLSEKEAIDLICSGFLKI